MGVLVALLALSASRISFVEDISSFLPSNAENKRENEAFQKLAASNRIVISFSQKDTLQGVDEYLLTDAASRFSEIVLANDAKGHIKELICEVDNEKTKAVTDFITQNLPFFLEEADYARMDSVIQSPNLAHRLQQSRDVLMSPMGGFVRDIILNDPLYFSQNALKNLNHLKQDDTFNSDNGFIFNENGECIVVITSNYPVSETNNNQQLANNIYNAIHQTEIDFDNAVNIIPFGASLISITNAEQIKSDSLLAVSLSLVLILALLFYFFRNVRTLFFIALSIAFGALFSLAVIVLFKSTVSIIAIGISSIIFGIAINYPLHFLAHFRHNRNVKQTIREIVNPLLIGNITTVAAFLSILFLSSDAMKDLGLFSSFLLVGTIVFVLIFLPHFLSGTSKNSIQQTLSFGKLADYSPERNKFIVFTFLLFTIVLFFFSFGTTFETNLSSINYMTDEQRIEMNKLETINAGKKTLYVVTEAENIEKGLQNYENFVLPYLNENIAASGISNLFPSKNLQRQKIARWNDFWANRKDDFIHRFNRLASQQGFNDNAFESFIATINKDFQQQDFDYFAPIYNNAGEHYFSISADRTFIYTIIKEDDAHTSSHIFSNATSDPIFTFNNSSIAYKMVDVLSEDFNKVLYICAVVVFLFLFFSFGRIELAVMTFIPLAVAWIWILGLMNIFDIKFNIVNIILATFIFGQGDDYTIFVTEGLMYEYSRGKKMLASFKNSIILSATILFIAIGMLIFAKHPAMRSLAELAIVGMISVVMCAYLLPPLIYRFLTEKKGKAREVPWTITRFLRSLLAFLVFLVGSLLITVYGFFLFAFRNKRSEQNKLRFHQLLRWIAEFVIRRVPGVKFSLENLSGETFNKPAVIIANHQSHLDLMCLMMLSPKLIILTNDWVWKSPFYGKIVRYADFYPVSQGVENSLEQLSDAVNRGYSIVIFPEGTRSPDCSVKRFHRGAFYLAEKLNLDIVPVFLHGVGQVLPKDDFLLREGAITLQIRERIRANDSEFASDYQTKAKQIRRYYQKTYTEIAQRNETLDYFNSFVLHNYMYKGVEIWRGAKKEMQCKRCDGHLSDENKSEVIFQHNGYGVQSFLYALANKDKQIIAVEEDEDKVAVARSCAGLPNNLMIYSSREFSNKQLQDVILH
jgi:1-acyl-sn-glycerol-3-phosphate acyltransferase